MGCVGSEQNKNGLGRIKEGQNELGGFRKGLKLVYQVQKWC